MKTGIDLAHQLIDELARLAELPVDTINDVTWDTIEECWREIGNTRIINRRTTGRAARRQ